MGKCGELTEPTRSPLQSVTNIECKIMQTMA
jgi:hypothetical protein